MEKASNTAEDSKQKMSPSPRGEQAHTKTDNFYTPSNYHFYDTFSYAPLDKSQRRFRLLRIHNSEDRDNNATIVCDVLDNVSIADMEEKFITISYCAGDPKQTETVMVNGLQFNAFANLGHALRQARFFWREHRTDQELLLWADQICIDQSDQLERSHQVNFMGDIYAAAELVLISLSKDGDLSGGLAWLKSLHEDITKLDFDHFWGPSSKYWTDEDLHQGHDIFLRVVVPSPYWKRAWVRQEFIRSRKAYFLAQFEYCEEKQLAYFIEEYSAARFRRLGRDCSQISPIPYIKYPGTSDADPCRACTLHNNLSTFLDYIVIIKSFFKGKMTATTSTTGPNLLENLECASRCEASDDRDLIYAFLGLSSDTFGLSPDYSSGMSFSDVHCQLARNVIDHRGSIDFFHASIVTHRPWKIRKPLEIPSWVPYWLTYDIQKLIGPKKPPSLQWVGKFPLDEQGRTNRILQVRGIRQAVYVYLSTNEKGYLYNYGQKDYELWWIDGSYGLYVFKNCGQYYQLMDEIVDWETASSTEGIFRSEEGIRLVEENDSSVQVIDIC